MNQLIVKYRFRFYPHVVATDKKELWQLEHFKKRRTCPLRKLTYNKDRKAFRINSQWVSRKRLLNLAYPVEECIDVSVKSACDVLLIQLKNMSKTCDLPIFF